MQLVPKRKPIERYRNQSEPLLMRTFKIKGISQNSFLQKGESISHNPGKYSQTEIHELNDTEISHRETLEIDPTNLVNLNYLRFNTENDAKNFSLTKV